MLKYLPRLQNALAKVFQSQGLLSCGVILIVASGKTGTTIYKHTQDIVGRMYRKFMQDDQVTIRFKCALLDNDLYIIDNESKFKANDPLFLMKDTALPDLPGDFKGESFFEVVDNGKYEFGIADENGVEQKVQNCWQYRQKACFRRNT